MRKCILGIMALLLGCGSAGCIAEDAINNVILTQIIAAIMDALQNLPVA